jgi:hypothetical protein
MNATSGLGALIAVAVAVALFLVFRFIVLWYWRVNEAVALLRSIDEKLGRMAVTAAPREPYISSDHR